MFIKQNRCFKCMFIKIMGCPFTVERHTVPMHDITWVNIQNKLCFVLSI